VHGVGQRGRPICRRRPLLSHQDETMSRTTTFAALLLAASASGAAAETCLRADDKAEAKVTGTLAIVKFKHPGNRSNQEAYVVRLAKPICADVTDIDNKVQRVNKIGRVQLAGELNEPTLKRLLNKRVTVGGTYFGQHTAYHIAPILVQLKSIDPAR
jgi:hypothetical protein